VSTYSLFILGCQQNRHDALVAARVLEGLGYTPGPENTADVIVTLACSVRQHAVDRIHGKLNKWAAQTPKPKVIITGCVLPEDRRKLQDKVGAILEAEEISEEILEPILGRCTEDLCTWGDSKAQASTERGVLERYSERGAEPATQEAAKYTGPVFIPVMIGCNYFCTYCAVPFTRGAERSRELSDIIAEAEAAIRAGAKEIQLLGQTVNSYGRDRRHPVPEQSSRPGISATQRPADQHFPDFAALLTAVAALPGDFMISFLSPYPTEFSDESIKVIAENPKISKRVHLPVQSGDNEVLRRMNRRYTKEVYTEIAKRLLRQIPGCTLTTDIVVGFPGETKNQFERTVGLCREIPFAQVFLGKYSARSGTVATRFFKDDVPREEKERRWQVLNDMINK